MKDLLLASMLDSIEGVGGTTGVLWILVGITLVFFMQAGFAMVEAGFTRAKNTGNIIMKNAIDFTIGSFVFWLFGYGIMHGIDNAGIIGTPINPFGEFDWMHLMFQMVFCATAATIVSGAMAERTKFSAYCVYSMIISLLIYPISGHWIWGGGWLSQLGFVDFAGSTAVHLVGGTSALIGAAILGPRLGKYKRLPDGKLESKAIPGHSIALGALGVFILWFGWYGFNGSSTYAFDAASSVLAAKVFVTTTLACSAATLTAMFITWIKYKKPDVSMTLNGALAGLVAVTAGCANVSPLGSTIIGIIAGFVVVFGIEFIDKKLHIDDPVGAIAVHGLCGATGTILVGFFCETNGVISGLIKNDALTVGEAFKFLGVQVLGVITVIAWVTLTMTIVFFLIKKIIGLRVSKEEEIKGLDITEHGLPGAYPDFMPVTMASSLTGFDGEEAVADPVAPADIDDAVKVTKVTACVGTPSPLSKVVILANYEKFEPLKAAMDKIGITGMTVTNVTGCGMQRGGAANYYRGVKMDMKLLPKIKMEIVVAKIPVDTVIETAKKALYSGNYGDGKIFVYDVRDVVRIRTGETGYDALQDE